MASEKRHIRAPPDLGSGAVKVDRSQHRSQLASGLLSHSRTTDSKLPRPTSATLLSNKSSQARPGSAQRSRPGSAQRAKEVKDLVSVSVSGKSLQDVSEPNIVLSPKPVLHYRSFEPTPVLRVGGGYMDARTLGKEPLEPPLAYEAELSLPPLAQVPAAAATLLEKQLAQVLGIESDSVMCLPSDTEHCSHGGKCCWRWLARAILEHVSGSSWNNLPLSEAVKSLKTEIDDLRAKRAALETERKKRSLAEQKLASALEVQAQTEQQCQLMQRERDQAHQHLDAAQASEQDALLHLEQMQAEVRRLESELADMIARSSDMKAAKPPPQPNLRLHNGMHPPTMKMAETIRGIEDRGNLRLNFETGELTLRACEFLPRKPSQGPAAEFQDYQSVEPMFRDVVELWRLLKAGHVSGGTDMTVEGHTKEVKSGTKEFWQQVASNRAQRVEQELEARGIDADKVHAKGLCGKDGVNRACVIIRLDLFGAHG